MYCSKTGKWVWPASPTYKRPFRLRYLDLVINSAFDIFRYEKKENTLTLASSFSWGVRNASLLLYAALIQRLFSNRKENHLPLARRTSIVDFFSQYNGLVPDLVSALASGIGKTDPESLGSVFSVLLLLSLLATTSASPRAMELVAAFLPLVDACAASSVWKVRIRLL